MKSFIYTIIVSFFPILLMAQIQVSTITEPFKGSGGLSLDAEGNLYIGDFGDFLSAGDNDGQFNNIMKLDTEGNLSVYATGFVGASGNAFNSEGVLYQADIGTSQIFKIVNGTKVFITSTGINGPVGLVFDSQDNLYVCNCSSSNIRKVTPAGVSTAFSNNTNFFCPNGITVDENDNLYVSNFSDGKILKITPSGFASVIANVPGGNNGHLRYFEGDSTLYVASHGSSNIYTVDLDGNVALLAGTGVRGNTDGGVDEATFSRPNGIVLSSTGDTIYVNCSVPLTNTPNNPLNPELIRMITNVKGLTTGTDEEIEAVIESLSIHQLGNGLLKINVTSPIKNDFQVAIYDIQAKRLISKEWTDIIPGENELRMDIAHFVAGTYILAIYKDNQVLKSLKFVVF